MLQAAGAEVDAERADGCTALLISAEEGSLDNARTLLEHGADVGHMDMRAMQRLHIACMAGHAELATLLLEASQGQAGEAPAPAPLLLSTYPPLSCPRKFASDTSHPRPAPTRLLCTRIDPGSPTCAHFHPLPPALTQHGADVHALDGSATSALVYSASSGETVATLLQRGADVNRANVEGGSPLILAASMGQGHIFEALLVRPSFAAGRRGPGAQALQSSAAAVAPATASAYLTCRTSATPGAAARCTMPPQMATWLQRSSCCCTARGAPLMTRARPRSILLRKRAVSRRWTCFCRVKETRRW